MAKKHKHPEHVNHERWLVSYADFITLLFAFFVVMFAVSQSDSAKLGRFTEAVNAASTWGIFEKSSPAAPPISADGAVVPVRGRSRGNGPFVSRRSLRGALGKQLASSVVSGRVQLTESSDGLVIRLRDAAYFESGSAELKAENLGDLEAVAQSMRSLPNHLRIEGHTDSRPISSTLFPSNWELSAARASAVLRYFRDQANVNPDRMSVAGYADTRPLRDEDNPEAYALNRRVDIVVLDPTEWRAQDVNLEGDLPPVRRNRTRDDDPARSGEDAPNGGSPRATPSGETHTSAGHVGDEGRHAAPVVAPHRENEPLPVRLDTAHRSVPVAAPVRPARPVVEAPEPEPAQRVTPRRTERQPASTGEEPEEEFRRHNAVPNH